MAGANPWETAPYHLFGLLAPGVSEAGYADGCMWPSYGRPAPLAPLLYTYPGDGTTIYYHETVRAELPSAPGDHVGLPQGTNTGPHLYVLAWGTSSGQLTSASLTGPSGPLDVRYLDNTSSPVGMRPGAIIIPVAPLLPATTYTAAVTFVAQSSVLGPGEVALSKTWSFTTRPQTRPAQALVHLGTGTRTTIAMLGGYAAGQTASVNVQAEKWYCPGHGLRCHLRRSGAPSKRHVVLSDTQPLKLGCAAAYNVFVTVPAFSAVGIDYRPTRFTRILWRTKSGVLARRPLGGWAGNSKPGSKPLPGCRQ